MLDADSSRMRERSLAGDVLLTLPLPLSVLSSLLGVGVLGLLGLAAFGQFASRESVKGWLTPSGGLVGVAASSGGTLTSIPLAEGDLVRGRQVLATLRVHRNIASGPLNEQLVHAVSIEERAALAREAADLRRLETRREELKIRLETLGRERLQTLERIRAQEQQVVLAKEQVERAEAVTREGFFPMTQFQNRRAALLSAQDYLAQLRGTLLAQERESAGVRKELEAAPADLAALKAQSLGQQASLAQRRIAIEAEGIEVLTAPVEGRVLALPRQVGQLVQAGGVVALLAPVGSQMEAELFVPSRAAGFIRAGQPVRIKYAAFPYRRFGLASATVKSVSRTVLPPSEAGAAGIKADEPVFRVRAQLSSQNVEAYGRRIPLQPGMLLQADIETGRRSMMGWLLDPIRAARRA